MLIHPFSSYDFFGFSTRFLSWAQHVTQPINRNVQNDVIYECKGIVDCITSKEKWKDRCSSPLKTTLGTGETLRTSRRMIEHVFLYYIGVPNINYSYPWTSCEPPYCRAIVSPWASYRSSKILRTYKHNTVLEVYHFLLTCSMPLHMHLNVSQQVRFNEFLEKITR